MFDIRKEMIKEYKQKLEYYWEILGTLPTETSKGLENILLNPTSEREIEFCISCFKFLNDNTQFFKDIKEDIRKRNQSKDNIIYFEETLDMVLSPHRMDFERKKEFHTQLLGLRLELISELSSWTKEKLKRILTNPNTDEEFRLCQEYLEFLDNEKDFLERKNKYLRRLEYRQEKTRFLPLLSHEKEASRILLNPRTDKELDFCISYFGFQDDIEQIKENFKQGKIASIDPNKSDAVNHITKIVQAALEGNEMKEELVFLLDQSKTADIFYELAILDCDRIKLVETIANKMGYDFAEEKSSGKRLLTSPDFRRIYYIYCYVTLCINDFALYGVDRENKQNGLDKFVIMAEVFHDKYLNGGYFNDTSNITFYKQKIKK